MAEVMVDHLVLTAANEAQARAYRAQLSARDMSRVGRWHVLPDPGGKRVGSGAATIAALRHVEKVECKSGLRGVSVLILHSGGDSRRLPAYAAQGKVFVPVGVMDDHGRELALFDVVLEDMLEFQRELEGQNPDAHKSVVIAAGDVFLDAQAERPDWTGREIVGVGFRAPKEVAHRHGVYVLDAKGEVREFWQKPDEEMMRRAGAVDRRGRAIVDSGIVVLPTGAAERLARVPERVPTLWRGVLAQDRPALDLYQHLMMAWATKSGKDYLSRLGVEGGHHEREYGALHRSMHDGGMRAHVMRECPFLHLGTTREYLAGLTNPALASGMWTWKVPGQLEQRLERRRVVAACAFKRAPRLMGGNLVVGWPAEQSVPERLAKDIGGVWLPVRRDEWCVVAFGVGDDFKTGIEDGGTICGRSLARVENAVGRTQLWDSRLARTKTPPPSDSKTRRTPPPLGAGEERSAWNARLWPVTTTRKAWRLVEWITKSGGMPSEAWREAKRVSLSELMTLVNHERLLRHQEACRVRERLERLGEVARWSSTLSAREIVEDLGGLDVAERRERARSAVKSLWRAYGEEQDASDRARLARMIVCVCDATKTRPPVNCGGLASLHALAWRHVRESVAREIPTPPRLPRAGVRVGEVVYSTAPVRIDLAGGWTDTPPICSDKGGRVVNVAITLDGEHPIRATCKRLPERGIRVTSVDLEKSVVFREASELRAFDDPGDWAALPKAALVLSGLVPADGRGTLESWLRHVGGVELTVSSSVPKGSGLGTSSILGAAVLSALARLVGERLSREALIERTSVLEQMMSTGGGWQDQAGGIVPGVKLLTTEIGARQVPRVEEMTDVLSRAEMRGRLLLYSTGIQRLAKNILQQVVTRYLERDPGTMETLSWLGSKAREAQLLDAMHGRFDLVKTVNEYWRLKKAIDPGATTPAIEKMLDPIRHELSAHMLPGAGGGGFVFMIAKSAAAARRVRERLERKPPNALARFYEFAVDSEGLKTVVL